MHFKLIYYDHTTILRYMQRPKINNVSKNLLGYQPIVILLNTIKKGGIVPSEWSSSENETKSSPFLHKFAWFIQLTVI